MTLKDVHTLPKGYLIYLEDRPLVRNKWFVGVPIATRRQTADRLKNNPNSWTCEILAGETRDGTKIASLLYIFLSDTFTPIPPQDLVKYLNNLTPAGAEFLKNLSIKGA